jgi:diacylglycerol kinase (ATP)
MITFASRILISNSSARSDRKPNVRVTLIHNPQAGDDDNPVLGELVGLIKSAGHSVSLRSSKSDQLAIALEDPGDLVAVAGGDGTVGAVASRLIGRHVPIAVLPLGTANNISSTLGLTSRPVEELIAGWAAARRIQFDVGLVRGPWGKTRFIEGLGAGLFANAISQLDAREDVTFGRNDNRDEKTASALRWLKERVWDWPAKELQISLDGKDLSGEYVLFQVMNIQHIGPSLRLAPDADPGDGLLDVVLVKGTERDKLGEYLFNRLEGHPHPPRLSVSTGKRLKLRWESSDMHIDDKVWPVPVPTTPESPALVDVKVESNALEFLVS